MLCVEIAVIGNVFTYVASSDRFDPLWIHGRNASGTRSVVATVDLDTAKSEHRACPKRHLVECCYWFWLAS